MTATTAAVPVFPLANLEQHVDALRACLVWYTTSKLTPSNRGFIDSTPWDDANCEFDPRVFQAYVWRTAPP